MSAKTTFNIDDRSTNVVSLAGISIGMAVMASKGEPFTPKFITKDSQLLDQFGDVHPALGSTLYAAKRYLDQGNALWMARAVSDDAKCAAALVRSKVRDLPQTPVGEISSDCLAVLGLKDGLTWDEAQKYVFPTYLGNRVYSNPQVTVTEITTNKKIIPVSDVSQFEEGQRISLVVNPDLDDLNDPTNSNGEDLAAYIIEEVVDTEITKEVVHLGSAITATKGTEVMYMASDVATSYSPAIFLTEDVNNANTIVVNNSDLINGVDTLSVNASEATVVSKELIKVPSKALALDAMVAGPIALDTNVLIIEEYEFEDRDAFLVHLTPGTDGNRVSIGTEKSATYDNAFVLVVYLDGIENERFEVTRDYFVDGFGRQMYIEDKINGVSKHIRVRNNHACVDTEGRYTLPVITDYSVWLRDPTDVFVDATSVVTEDVLIGHQQIWVDAVNDLAMGMRIKIHNGRTNELGEEYKIVAVSGQSITIDRKATMSYAKADVLTIYRFDATLDNPSEGIKEGIQYYTPVKQDKVYPANHVGDGLTISGMVGTLVDTGVSFTLGGSNGSPVSVGNMIIALDTLKNPGKTPINAVCDGGLAVPAYAQAVYDVVVNQKDAHGFVSSPGELEDYVDAPARIVEYRNSLGLDDRMISLFSGWIKKFDEINQVDVWECPSIYAVNAQSFVTRTKTMFTPAAGNVNGKVVGLDVRYKFSEGERDLLVANQINPIKYDNGVITIWGNETLLKRPSPLQLRSVNMLLIAMQVGVRSLNEYKLFDFNNEATWGALEGAVDAFIRDDFQSKGGVYDYSVSVEGVITDTDVNSRRMPLFIGIQPTLDIQTIPTTIAIYSKGSEIQVSL